MSPDPAQRALEIYARGLAGTRQAAANMVAQDPQGCERLLRHVHGEMLTDADVAFIDEWGHANTGQDEAA